MEPVPEILIKSECKLSDPFKRISAKLEDPAFLKEIATRDPDNKIFMQALEWTRRLALLGGYDCMRDEDIKPT